MARKNQLTTSDHFKYDEYKRFVSALHEDKEYVWEMFARLSFCTACRASDVLPIRWGQILNAKSLVIAEQKTSKARSIPINPSIQGKIQELWKLMGYPDKHEYVFRPVKRQVKGNEPMTIQYVNQKMKVFKRKYKLDIGNFSTHTFRKTFGRYVYDTNNHSAESLLLLNQILKHSSIEITKRYIGITKDEIDSVFNSLQF